MCLIVRFVVLHFFWSPEPCPPACPPAPLSSVRAAPLFEQGKLFPGSRVAFQFDVDDPGPT